MGSNGISMGMPDIPSIPGPPLTSLIPTFSSCLALVTPLSRDNLLDLSMTLTRLSGAQSSCYPLVAQLLAEWVASSPFAKGRWAEATEVGYPTFARTKQMKAVKQYASFLFLPPPAPDLLGLLMDLNALKVGFRTVFEYMTRRGAAYTAATGYPFPQPIPTLEKFLDTWKEMAKVLELRPPVSIADPPTSSCSWLLQLWVRYVQLRPSFAHAIDWTRPLLFVVCGDVYPCATPSWTQLSVGLINKSALGHTHAYLWAIGMTVCGDKYMAAIALIWAQNL